MPSWRSLSLKQTNEDASRNPWVLTVSRGTWEDLSLLSVDFKYVLTTYCVDYQQCPLSYSASCLWGDSIPFGLVSSGL